MNKDAKAMAINVAMNMDLGKCTPKQVLDAFGKDNKSLEAVLEFWTKCSPLTRKAASQVCRLILIRHLEQCYNKDIDKKEQVNE